MALSGIQIYKLLPQTNCQDCEYPTCLAFAMKLASKQADLDDCPHVSEQAREKLAESAAPPIRLTTVSSNGRKVEAGNELVLFRHEKQFYHPTGIFVRVYDSQPLDAIKAQTEEAMSYTVEYVGMDLGLDGMAVHATGDGETFARAVEAVLETAEVPLILIAEDAEVMSKGLEVVGDARPLIHAATPENWESFAELAQEFGVPLSVQAATMSALADLTQKVQDAGVKEIVLDPAVSNMHSSLALNTVIRRKAIDETFRPLGFPTISFAAEIVEDESMVVIAASQAIAKYAGYVVLDRFSPAMVYPLLVLRTNIYTNPQEPIQVEPGAYEINDPGPDAPLMVTTNFSITYFSVANEVDGSGIPSWLLVADAEGMSVLTAWAAGEFDAERIAKAVRTTDMKDKVKHRKLIIPGHVAVLLGELEEELPDWEILVGPREAVDLPGYLKVWGAA
ncbi:MAG: acetyl-CoA decarbonylase/synthase complex subunit gamma [Anaerolineae bacterium]|jgi:acetyl-CoA decarbonylase/synthase complex subunit gamma